MTGDNVPQKIIDAYTPIPFKVYRSNWDTVQLFLALRTQWMVGMSGPTGINYVAIEPTARLMDLQVTPEIFNGIRLMEGSAMETMRDQKH